MLRMDKERKDKGEGEDEDENDKRADEDEDENDHCEDEDEQLPLQRYQRLNTREPVCLFAISALCRESMDSFRFPCSLADHRAPQCPLDSWLVK